MRSHPFYALVHRRPYGTPRMRTNAAYGHRSAVQWIDWRRGMIWDLRPARPTPPFRLLKVALQTPNGYRLRLERVHASRPVRCMRCHRTLRPREFCNRVQTPTYGAYVVCTPCMQRVQFARIIAGRDVGL